MAGRDVRLAVATDAAALGRVGVPIADGIFDGVTAGDAFVGEACGVDLAALDGGVFVAGEVEILVLSRFVGVACGCSFA